jgi:hypothetical protein
MSVDRKQPKGYRKAWNGELGRPSEVPLGSHAYRAEGTTPADALRQQRANQRAGESSTEHMCSGCHRRWTGELTGAVLCGDCWRKAQGVVHGIDRVTKSMGGVELQPDVAMFLSDLAYRWALLVQEGHKTIGYALRTVAVLAYEHAQVVGIKAVHAIITPTCRNNRGHIEAFDEAVRRLKNEYLACQGDANADANFHVVLTVERPPSV